MKLTSDQIRVYNQDGYLDRKERNTCVGFGAISNTEFLKKENDSTLKNTGWANKN